MLIIALLVFTIAFYIAHYSYAKRFPGLLSYIVCSTAVVSAIQSARFFYLLVSPSLKTIPRYGATLSNGMGWIDVPMNLDACLRSLGSDFDLLMIAVGPIAVVYLSIKQVVETIVIAQSPSQSNQASNQSKQSSGSSTS